MEYSKFEILKKQTRNTTLIWKNVHGIATESVANKMDNAMLHWIVQLTETMQIWIDKGTKLTDGELILARTNIGAVVESWLKFYYCVFYEEYQKEPLKDGKGKTKEPDKKMSFEELKEFSINKLWKDKQEQEYIWVDKVQHMRNAIHAFNYKNIGTPKEFMEDIDRLYDFVDNIINHLPPIEEFLETYPKGYEKNLYF